MSENSCCQSCSLPGSSSKIATDIKMDELALYLLFLLCVCFYNVMASSPPAQPHNEYGKQQKVTNRGESQEKGFPEKALDADEADV